MAWGALHSSYLVLERLSKPVMVKLISAQPIWLVMLMRASAWLLTLLLVMLAWVWFRAADAGQAFEISAQMSRPNAQAFSGLSPAYSLMAWAFLMLIGFQLAERRWRLLARLPMLPPVALGLLLAVLSAAIVLSPGNARAFIYFQF